ncbi:MAG: hypothetical protein ABI665_23065 [Vicinamibacterales bacterium]
MKAAIGKRSERAKGEAHGRDYSTGPVYALLGSVAARMDGLRRRYLGEEMKILLTAASLAVAIGVAAQGSTVAAQEKSDAKKYDKGSIVTLQGCVTTAEKKDTYVLTQVQEWPVANSSMGEHGRRMYWIDKGSKELKPHVGHTIQVQGIISDVEESEMELKVGENGGGLMVKIEGPGHDVVTTPEKAGVNPAALTSDKDIKITLLKLKVDNIKMMSSTCSSTMQ